MCQTLYCVQYRKKKLNVFVREKEENCDVRKMKLWYRMCGLVYAPIKSELIMIKKVTRKWISSNKLVFVKERTTKIKVPYLNFVFNTLCFSETLNIHHEFLIF